jgi:hypothetical protein
VYKGFLTTKNHDNKTLNFNFITTAETFMQVKLWRCPGQQQEQEQLRQLLGLWPLAADKNVKLSLFIVNFVDAVE